MHDYGARPSYHVVEEFTDIIETSRSGNLVKLRRSRNASDELILDMEFVLQYQLRTFTFTIDTCTCTRDFEKNGKICNFLPSRASRVATRAPLAASRGYIFLHFKTFQTPPGSSRFVQYRVHAMRDKFMHHACNFLQK